MEKRIKNYIHCRFICKHSGGIIHFLAFRDKAFEIYIIGCPK